ncbi:hypothetical protein AgCh_022029 [Apium graveolens]
MDRSWINIRDKLSEEYTKGISEFIDFVEKFVNSKDLVLCTCCRCINKQSQALNVIKLHLVIHGFLNTYKIWYHHGEQIDDLKDKVIFDDQDWDSRDEQDDLAEGLNDANNTKYFDVGPTSDLIKDSDKVSYRWLMNLKVLNKMTDKAFDDMLKFLKEILPERNSCPENYYQTRKLLCEVGLGYEHIDVCQYDCVIFYGPNANADGLAWKHFDNAYPDFAANTLGVRGGGFVVAVNINSELFYPGEDIARIPNAAGKGQYSLQEEPGLRARPGD